MIRIFLFSLLFLLITKESFSKENSLRYEVIFTHEGFLPSEVIKAVEKTSYLLRTKERPPQSETGLLNRLEKEESLVIKVLESFGFFDAQVQITYKKQNPLLMTCHMKPGAHYRIGSIKLIFMQDNPIFLKNDLIEDIVGLHQNDFVNIQNIREGQKRIQLYFQSLGHPFVELLEPHAFLDKETSELHLTYEVKLGPSMNFGQAHVCGLKNLSEQFVKNRLLWRKGELFNQKKIDQTRRKLLSTGLFSTVEIDSKLSTTNPENADVTLDLKEGAPRALGAGGRYATSEGFGANLFWRHQNVRGKGEQAEASLDLSKKKRQIKLVYAIPDNLVAEDLWLNDVAVTRERTRAYTNKALTVGTRLQRPLTSNLRISGGLISEISQVKREDRIYRSRLGGLPLEGILDTTQDLLNPTSGIRSNLKVTPYLGRIDKTRGMVITQAGISAYLPFLTNTLKQSRFVLASFLRGGVLSSQSRDAVPPNKRFYSGGGGSIRGYGYQLLGPVDSDGTPYGGISMAEIGTELRLQATDTLGLAVFFEGGAISDKKMPALFKKETLYSFGIGGRYYTSFGPIRLDIGFPCKRRRLESTGKLLDSPFQFYITIGQAF